MSLPELLLLAAGLSMDAFAVSITNGLCCHGLTKYRILLIGICFGSFQGMMPVIGYFLGKAFSDYITAMDHYIALILLGFIGGKMIVDACHSGEAAVPYVLTGGLLLMQGLATSIDALAVGVSLAALPDVSIATAAISIAGITGLLSVMGVSFGRHFGTALGSRAQLAGGLILIGIGGKIFLEHMLG